MVILKEIKSKKNAAAFSHSTFLSIYAQFGQIGKGGPGNLISHILCFLFSLANQTVEIESLPSSSCHSKHSVNQTVKHYLPKVYKSIFYYYYYYFNFKNELYSKYDRNDTNLKFMKLKSNKDFVIIILK